MGAPTLVHLLARAVEQRPGAEALVCGQRRERYEDLWQRVARLAGLLSARGVAPGDRVALVLQNSPEYVAAYYAVLSLGGLVTPLSAEARSMELAGCIAHCAARAVLVDQRNSELPALKAAIGRNVLVLTPDEAAAMPPRAPDLAGEALHDPARPAAIMYTSGTTSDPKGVTLSHGNLVSNVLAIVEYLGLQASDRVLTTLPFHYSYGNSVLHTHLAVGGCVVVAANMMYPQRVVDTMCDERVTGFSGVPWMYRLLLDRTRLAAMRRQLGALRYLTQAGAPMAPGDIQRVIRALPGVAFIPMYGQTEATARVSYLPPGQVQWRPGSVGIPIPNTQLEVRRSDGTRASTGEEGEVFASGPGIMLGYWNAPEATRDAIVDEPSGRWLRTGDVGYTDRDGYLYLRGRSSEMIKTGAHRVSPFEIEEALLRCDAIADAAAFGVPDDMLGESIEAAVVLKPGTALTERELFAHCRAHLSLYKVPRRLHFAATFPRTASGKLRRRALAGLVESGMAT